MGCAMQSCSTQRERSQASFEPGDRVRPTVKPPAGLTTNQAGRVVGVHTKRGEGWMAHTYLVAFFCNSGHSVYNNMVECRDGQIELIPDEPSTVTGH